MTPASALLLSLAASGRPTIPTGPSAVADLSTTDHAHHEVLRIDRDFGMPQWEIALDGWVSRGDATHLEDVRLWWVNTDKDDRRKPFSKYLRKFIEFGYERGADGTLEVRLAGDRKAYTFAISVAGGSPEVRADVQRGDGVTLRGCRCRSGRLIARRVLGIPVGIGALRVECEDEAGATHSGDVPFETLDNGPVYEPPA